MNRYLGICIACSLAISSSLAFGQVSQNTHQQVPTNNSTFLSDLRNFLSVEEANRFAEQFTGFVVSGGTHGTGGGLTQTPAALTAYPGGFYITETGTITYNDATANQWVVCDNVTTGNKGTFTRVSGTHYLLDTTSGASKPTLCSNCAWLMQVTTAGGTVTAVTDLRSRVPQAQTYLFAELPAAGSRGRVAWVRDNTTYYYDTGSAWVAFGNFTNPMTTSGDSIYGGASGVATRLPIGTTNQVDCVTAGLPSWCNLSTIYPLGLVTLTNKSGSGQSASVVVIIDTTNDSAFTTVSVSGSTKPVGVVFDATINNNSSGNVQYRGIITVNVQGNVTRGDYLRTSSTTGRAEDAGGLATVNGVFGIALTGYAGGGGGTVSAFLFGTTYSTAIVSVTPSLDGTRNLKVVPTNVTQGTFANAGNTYAAVTSGFYNLFDGTQNDGFVISCTNVNQCTSFNAVISVGATPTTVEYATCQSGTWTAVSPTATATWTNVGYTQTRGIPTAAWTTGACGTANIPSANFNLRVRQTSGTTTVTGRISLAQVMDLTIDEVIMADGSGNKYRYTAVAVSPDITQAQVVNGRDQAVAFSNSSYVYLWGTGGGANFHSLWSASSTAPTLQGGDTAKVLLGGYRMDTNTLLLPWNQWGKEVNYGSGGQVKDGNGITGTSGVLVSLSVTVPAMATHGYFQLFSSGGGFRGAVSDTPSTGSGAGDGAILAAPSATISTMHAHTGPVPLTIPQTIYYDTQGVASNWYTIGYRMPGNLN
jgi:hypothetical protein